MNKYTIALAIPLFLASLALSAQTITGRVYYTQTSKKGVSKEMPIPEVMVTDGTSIVTTRSDGSFDLETSPKSTYIAITTPDGYTSSKFYQPISSDTQSYQFLLSQTGTAKSRVNHFIVVNDAIISPNATWISDIKQQAFYSNAAFVISTGKHSTENDAILEKELGIPVYRTFSSEIEFPSMPNYYSFIRGGIHFIALSAIPNNNQHPIKWLREALTTVGRSTPTILINNSAVKKNDSETVSANGDTLRLADFNIKSIIDGSNNINLYDYRGKQITSTISTAPPTSGGVDHSPASFRLVSTNIKGEIATETALTNVPRVATIVSPGDTAFIEDGKIRFYANVYSSQSPTSRVRVGISKDSTSYKWCELNKVSAWTWSGFYVMPPTDSTAKYHIKLEAFAKNGQITTSEKAIAVATSSDSTYNAKQTGIKSEGNTVYKSFDNVPFSGNIAQQWTANPQGSIQFSSPVVIDTIVVIPSTNDLAFTKSKIVAFHTKTGKSIWHFFPKGTIKNTFTIDGANVMATDILGNVYAIDARTGTPIWQSSVNNEKQAPQLNKETHSDSLYLNVNPNRITALKSSNGAVAWSINQDSTHNASETTLTVGDGIILILNSDGGFVGINESTGKPVWSKTSEGFSCNNASMSYSNGLFHVVSGRKYLSINQKDGATEKVATLPTPISTKSAPLLSDNLLIFGSINNGLVAYDLNANQIAWRVDVGIALVNTLPNIQEHQKTVETSAVKIGRFIVFGASDGFLYVVDIANGAIKQKVNLGAPILSTPTIAGDTLYTTDISGNITAFMLL